MASFDPFTPALKNFSGTHVSPVRQSVLVLFDGEDISRDLAPGARANSSRARLSAALYPDGFGCLWAGCPAPGECTSGAWHRDGSYWEL